MIPPQPSQSVGVELIAVERQRQVDVEGWTPEHDDQHAVVDGFSDLAEAAACYLLHDRAPGFRQYHDGRFVGRPERWPWEHEAWKPSPHDRVRELVKAGALIAAEIDRLQREEARHAA